MTNKASWLYEKGGKLQVGDIEAHTPKDGEVLVRNRAVAINPVDAKIIASGRFVRSWPVVLGSDLAGVVESVGKGVTKVKAGDRVLGHAVALATGEPRNAAFQDFTVLPEQQVAVLPDSLSFDDASVIPLALDTSLVGLFPKEHLGLPLPGSKSSDKAVFVYGASSSVGSLGVQLAKAAGVYVFATASSANAEYARDLGADEVFDYKDAGAVNAIVSAVKKSGKDFLGVWDTIGLEPTSKFNLAVLEGLGGGRLFSVLPISVPVPDNVKSGNIFGLALPGAVGHKEAAFIWNEWLAGALADGTIKARPSPKVVGTGLETLQSAIDEYNKGVSASKLVVAL